MPVKKSSGAAKSAKKISAPKKKPVKSASKPVAARKVAPKKASVAKAAAPRKPVKSKAPAGMPELIRDAALKVLDERQAEDIITVDLNGKSALADYIIIASGRSARQLTAIADYMREAFAKLGIRKFQVEGVPQGDWVLIDAGDVLIHLFRPEVRTYYQIESIWGVGAQAGKTRGSNNR